MANEFTNTRIPEPRDVSGSVPFRETTAAAIGEGLKGVAAILDVGLKHSAEKREAKVLGTVEDALAVQAKEFSGAEVPQLVGEEGGSSSPEDIGFSGEGWAKIDRLRQGNKQGRVSRAEFYAKTSSIVQQAIHDNPRFSDSIRKRAQEVLGIAPTSAAIALEADGQKAEEDMQRAAKAKLLEIGISQYGIADMFPDGTFNVAGTIPKVQRAIATNAYLKSYNDVLDANIKYKTLMAGPEAKPLSLAERQDMEVRMFMGGDKTSGYQGADTLFHDQIDSFFSTIPTALKQNEKLGVPEQEAMIMGEIGQRRLVFMGWLNSQLNQVTMSPDSKEKVRKNYMDQFAQYEDWSKGGFSNLQRNVNTVQQLEARAKNNAWQISSVAQEARIIYGEQVWNSVASVLLATEAGSGTRDALDREALNIGRYLQHGARVAGGSARTSLLAPEDQKGAMAAVTATVDTTVKLLNSGQSALPEQDIATFGNSMIDLIDSSSRSQNVDNLRGATKWSASPAVIQTLGTLKAKNPMQAQEIGQGMMVTNAKTVALTGRALVRDVVANQKGVNFQNREGTGDQPTQAWDVVYNVDEGIVKAISNIPESENMQAPLPQIPKAISAKIRDMNAALNANALMAGEYGSDREKGMDGAALKQEYIKTSGLKIVGAEVDNVTSSDNKSGISAYPTGMVEPGNLDAINRKGLINPDGSESSALTFSQQDEDGLEVLVPQVIDGVKFSQDAAWKHYKMTGEHFGKFSTPDDADKFAGDLHTIMQEDMTARDKAKEAKKAKKSKNVQIKVVD